jgi:hypothetical protein
VYFGACYSETPDEDGRLITCVEEIWASPAATEVTCKVCFTCHPVQERRDWMLKQASDQLFTVREAAQLVGSFGQMLIKESTIRNYVSSGQLGYHGKAEGQSLIRLGDLFEVITTHAAKPKGRKLKRSA